MAANDTTTTNTTGKDTDDSFGTGTGAASGALTGAAIGAGIGGPVGAVIGAIAGTVTGAASGKAISTAVNAEEEDRYWRGSHSSQPFAGDRSYDDYSSAYKTGYEGYGKHGPGTSFRDAEAGLQDDYRSSGGESRLPWDHARTAAEAAWNRVHGSQATHGSAGGVHADRREV